MKLSKKTTIKVNAEYSNIIGHMCYAAYKLWNICNYERYHYKELTFPDNIIYPGVYYQEFAHKNNLWYKQLPAQSAQEVCKQLDKSWKSFYVLQKSGTVENPHPPRYKQSGIAVSYIQFGIKHEPGSCTVRLSLPSELKEYMKSEYGICEKFLYLENRVFRSTDCIKQIKIYPPAKGKCDIIVVHEIPDVSMKEDNGRYLSIDIGLHNLLTCYSSFGGHSFIIGRKYLSICYYFDKKIARIQSQWYSLQSENGVKYPKTSAHISALHRKKKNCINDYLHKVTRYIAEYCRENEIHTVIAGDITGIRKDSNLGHVTNGKLHSLPYGKILLMLEYKLKLEGINFRLQKESYTSQVSPLAPEVCKEYAEKKNRISRGLYADGDRAWNADTVGAFNILRLYLKEKDTKAVPDPESVRTPEVIKVAV